MILITKKYFPFICLTIAMILWSSSFIALKIAFRHYDPMLVIFGRMLVATLCFLLLCKPIFRNFSYRKGDYKILLFMAFCEPCLYFLFEAKALENTTASQAGMITAILPVLVMTAAVFLLREKIGIKGWAGSFLAVFGVCLLTFTGQPAENAPNPVLGNFYELVAMICATGYTIAMRFLAHRYSPLFLTATQAFLGCIFFFVMLFPAGAKLPPTQDPAACLAVIYLGAVITIGAYGFYNYGLKYVAASRAASFTNLIPVFTFILGWAVLDETLTGCQFMAALLVLFGVWFGQQATYEPNGKKR
ncbi:MAG: EamA family transporter [Deltaproteobacteria bacterium]|nr:MAG: EamA family transporter [Deltaproteobacteria bacterium]